MKKSTKKALKQLIVATIVFGGAIIGGLEMYFSGTFLPVYDGAGNWHLLPQLLRYALYAILGINALLAAYAISEAGEYLLKRLKKRFR